MRYRLILILISLTFWSAPSLADIEIIGILPKPNYSYAKSEGYYLGLTDGRLEKKRMWTKPGAIAWLQPSMINIRMKLINHDVDRDRVKKLAIHFGSSDKLNVSLPSFINVYSLSGNGYKHIGKKGIKDEVRNESAWVEVGVKVDDDSEEILLVIHPRSKVLVLDEIKLIKEKASVISVFERPGSDSLIKDVGKHSFSFIKNPVPLNNDFLGGVDLKLDVFDAFDRSTWWEKFGISKDIYVLGETQGYKVLRILRDGKSRSCVSLKVPEYVKVFSIKPIYSVYGNEIYDPLVPLDSCIEFENKNSRAFLLIKVDGMLAREGPFDIDLFFDEKKRSSITFHLDKDPYDGMLAASCLNINPWSYRNEIPLWSVPEVTYNFLKASNVNTFFIPPAHIPTVDEVWEKKNLNKKISLLKKDISLFEGAKNIILFPALDRKIDWDLDGGLIKARVKKWFSFINEIVSQESSGATMYLHLIDEVRGEKWNKFIFLSRAIKEIESDIKIYINPVLERNSTSEIINIIRAINYVDLWQPSYRFLEKYKNKPFFKAGGGLWFYMNPGYPPKEERLSFYKNLPLIALKNGYTGVGFWSATSTSKSSPWADYDGVRPDWAHLYLDDNGSVISSMRWEAFLSGLNIPCEEKNKEGTLNWQ